MSKNSRRTKKGSETRLKLQNIGQIKEADIKFGDLTVLVGPQATGKSILLQILKLILDTDHIHSTLSSYGFQWKDKKRFLEIYLGEGMRDLWNEKNDGGGASCEFNGRPVYLKTLATKRGPSRLDQKCYFIPAHRALTLFYGWPQPFHAYQTGYPYVVRDFSERLRLYMEKDIPQEEEVLFPREGVLKQVYREKMQQDIFAGYSLEIDRVSISSRLVLQKDEGEMIHYGCWSAGQREFAPLLLGLYMVRPSGRSSKRGEIDWVIIEEPEMGLHPKAISDVLLIVLDLLERGYRVCISTHSSHVLDLVWALKNIKENNGNAKHVLELFEVEKDQQVQQLLDIAQSALEKEYKVYYFEPDEKGMVTVKDISRLDPSSEEHWGDLEKFNTKACEVVAELVRSDYRRSGSDQVVALHVREKSE